MRKISRYPHWLRRLRQLRQRAHYAQAERLCQRALSRAPRDPELLYEWARLQELQGHARQAIADYQRVLSVFPRHRNTLYRLGVLFHGQNRHADAVLTLAQYLSLYPERASANLYHSLALSLVQLQQEKNALEFFLKAIEANPSDLVLYVQLSQALHEIGDLELALDCLMALGQLFPQKMDLISYLMGDLLERSSEIEAAQQCYADAVQRQPRNPIWKLAQQLAYPRIASTRAEIENFRMRAVEAFERFLMRLSLQPLRLARSDFYYLALLHSNNCHITYHHYLIFPLRQLMARMVTAILPSVPAWQAPPARSGRIRLGIYATSSSLRMVYMYSGAMADRLNPQEFEVILFCPSYAVMEYFQERAEAYRGEHVSWQIVSSAPFQSVSELRAAQLDAFFVTEPNWDFTQYVLALWRVAPVQFTSWMNPCTTGLSQMDYFLSSHYIERPGAEADYTETLVQWETLPSFVPAVRFPEPLPRSDFGLEDEMNIYGCLQNLLKIHPDFDQILGGILRQDERACVVMLQSTVDRLSDKLTLRWQKTLPDVMERIWLFPPLPFEQFLQLIQSCDVMLDPLYYGGGTTSYQCLALGVPLVTLPTDNMVGRISAALSARMEHLEDTVDSIDAYIERALYLGQHPEERARIGEHLRARAHLIYEDASAVQCFERFLQRVTRPVRASGAEAL